MPAPTPAASGEQPSEGLVSVPEALGTNIRLYRLTRRLEQEELAAWMQGLGHPWRRTTVSEVERANRNVTVAELLSLVIALDASVEELLRPRTPGGHTGPMLAFPVCGESIDKSYGWFGIPSKDFTAMICTHTADAEVEREQRRLGQIEFVGESLPPVAPARPKP